MKLTKESLRDIGIINAYDYASMRPYIGYNRGSSGGFRKCPAWLIVIPGKMFKNVPAYDYGHLVLEVYGRDEKKKVFIEITEKFKTIFTNVKELEKTPFGTWMEKSFVKERNEELSEMLKKSKNEL